MEVSAIHVFFRKFLEPYIFGSAPLQLLPLLIGREEGPVCVRSGPVVNPDLVYSSTWAPVGFEDCKSKSIRTYAFEIMHLAAKIVVVAARHGSPPFCCRNLQFIFLHALRIAKERQFNATVAVGVKGDLDTIEGSRLWQPQHDPRRQTLRSVRHEDV